MIDAVVNVGPLECMPSKVAEAQFFHIAQQEGLPTLTLAVNGDRINAETLDNFAFEIHERFRKTKALPAPVRSAPVPPCEKGNDHELIRHP